MSAETIQEYDAPLLGSDGKAYRARACGRKRADGEWEGWIEFESADGELVHRTTRETTQPNLVDLRYWSSGISAVYLEGALRRALEPHPRFHRKTPSPAAFDGPADDAETVGDVGVPAPMVDAIIDPYFAYAKGETFLRRQLGALDAWHIRNIAQAYHIVRTPMTLDELGKLELIELIVAHVRAHANVPAAR